VGENGTMGQKLVAMIKFLDITKAQFAEKCGISVPGLSGMLEGSKATKPTITKIGDGMEISYNYLAGMPDE